MKHYMSKVDANRVLVSTIWGGILLSTLFNGAVNVTDFGLLVQTFSAHSQSETLANLMALFSRTVTELQLLMIILTWLLHKRLTDKANVIVAFLSAALLLMQLSLDVISPILAGAYLGALLAVVWLTWAHRVIKRQLLLIAPTVR